MPRTDYATRWSSRSPHPLLGCLLAIAALLCAPAAARAQGGPGTCVASPNVSATDQYCETLPTAQGGVPVATPGAGGGETLRQTLSPEEVARLIASGPLGQAVLDLPANTPLTAAEERLLDSAGLAAGELRSPGAASEAADPIRAIARTVTSGGALPWLLAGLGLATLGAVGFGVVVLRTGGV
jgi:hypothetical protein